MFECDICKRKIKKKIKMQGYTLCSKHMHQLQKYGYFKDNNQRTTKDLNEFRYLNKDTIQFDVYNINSEVNGHFIIDANDLKKVRYHKWRKDTNDRIITGNNTNKHPRYELSRFLLNITNENVVVDHKDGNPFNNKKTNLRMCTQQNNVCNKSFMSTNKSGIIGVCWDKNRNRWAPEISYENKRCHLGRYKKFEEAIYARYIAEKLLFKEFQNEKQKMLKMIETISEIRQIEIKQYIIKKLVNKNMLKGD